MNQNFKQLILLLAFFVCFQTGNAQQSVNASGGNGTGAGGSFSFTVGEIDYGQSTGAGGTLTLGVQLPFEIMVVKTNTQAIINLEMEVYPNPTTAYLYLRITNYTTEKLYYQVYDNSGRIINQQKITSESTIISTEKLSAGNYLVQVLDNSKTLKIFKVIKK